MQRQEIQTPSTIASSRRWKLGIKISSLPVLNQVSYMTGNQMRDNKYQRTTINGQIIVTSSLRASFLMYKNPEKHRLDWRRGNHRMDCPGHEEGCSATQSLLVLALTRSRMKEYLHSLVIHHNTSRALDGSFSSR
jgi:hypothetical protein